MSLQSCRSSVLFKVCNHGMFISHSPADGFQDCLAKHSYNESKCRAQVDALYDCCNSFYSRYGDEAKSASCPQANLLRLKMKQRTEEASKR
ncbi:Cx9C motif-containing protein [Lachnellula suecica]|uniref:Cx9C motif-containing protein 4, mitochondrial n=1 Tax=Lachnellula suecica TaxID=602035 RepID=A0A8T9CCQ1_9HELO|nr:Cx9C motif-containing protein [Lachnellula suecica]